MKQPEPQISAEKLFNEDKSHLKKQATATG